MSKKKVSKIKQFEVPSPDTFTRRERTDFEKISGIGLRQLAEMRQDKSIPVMGVDNALLYIAVNRVMDMTLDEIIDSDFELVGEEPAMSDDEKKDGTPST